jgi:hypothetical protein
VIEEIQRQPLSAADLFEAPDLVEPVAAYRKWRVVEGRLRSLYLPVFWSARIQRADCRASHAGVPPHMAPGSGCTCGIYASHKPDLDFPTIDFRGVAGVVTVWGSIEVHEDGLRAEYAQVEALCLYERWTDRQTHAVRTAAESLGVDLVDLDDLEDAAEGYGKRLDPRLLGHIG